MSLVTRILVALRLKKAGLAPPTYIPPPRRLPMGVNPRPTGVRPPAPPPPPPPYMGHIPPRPMPPPAPRPLAHSAAPAPAPVQAGGDIGNALMLDAILHGLPAAPAPECQRDEEPETRSGGGGDFGGAGASGSWSDCSSSDSSSDSGGSYGGTD